jgi:hypothetical protein
LPPWLPGSLNPSIQTGAEAGAQTDQTNMMKNIFRVMSVGMIPVMAYFPAVCFYFLCSMSAFLSHLINNSLYSPFGSRPMSYLWVRWPCSGVTKSKSTLKYQRWSHRRNLTTRLKQTKRQSSCRFSMGWKLRQSHMNVSNNCPSINMP